MTIRSSNREALAGDQGMPDITEATQAMKISINTRTCGVSRLKWL
jgi:hypothetical protein